MNASLAWILNTFRCVHTPFGRPFLHLQHHRRSHANVKPATAINQSTNLLLRQQTSQAEIVDHILDLLDLVLDTIAPLPQRIVLQVQDLESSVHILDELGNLHRPPVVAESDRVPGQTRQLVEQRDQGLQVLLDGEVESVAVLEVGGHAEHARHVFERQQLAALRVHAAQVAAQQDAGDAALHVARPRVAVLVVWVLRGHAGEGLDRGDFFADAFAGCGQDFGD
jgi:hypothetical protein